MSKDNVGADTAGLAWLGMMLLPLSLSIIVAMLWTPHVGVCSAQPVGFWMGLAHGIGAWWHVVFSWFLPGIGFYECSNNGGWYNFGFLIGVGGAMSSSRR